MASLTKRHFLCGEGNTSMPRLALASSFASGFLAMMGRIKSTISNPSAKSLQLYFYGISLRPSKKIYVYIYAMARYFAMLCNISCLAYQIKADFKMDGLFYKFLCKPFKGLGL